MPNLPAFDPRAFEPASREIINAKRDFWESSPILIDGTGWTLDGHVWDCDQIALARMARLIAIWGDLGISNIDWTLADNTSLNLTLPDLLAAQLKITTKQAIRGIHIHAFAAGLKDMLPNVTILDVETAEWPI